ncbi:hypothetical protein E4U41_000848 [Claviceps citrina]|nr:hypothetical protein E4U41_000848 [Claviceps citrina]
MARLTDAELEADVERFVTNILPSVEYNDLLRAARVGKDIRLYDEAARQSDGYDERNRLLVLLTDEEKTALRKEKDNAFSERGMLVVIATVSLAAFLQGFVQSSFNGASLYKSQFGLTEGSIPGAVTSDDWKLGAANASPWFFAALVGCPLSLPINYWFGRRGGIGVAAFMILCSSTAAIFATSWTALFGIRIVNGVALVSPSHESNFVSIEGNTDEDAVHRVAFGIMVGFAFNLLFTKASSDTTTFRLIQGAPLVPSLALLVMALFVCPESPRYHLMKGPNYSVEKAFRELRGLRNTELQALRDMYVVYKSIEHENMDLSRLDPHASRSPGFTWAMRDFVRQYTQLFQRRRLRNALISTSTVNLAQQLCGVNVCAFYSGTLFSSVGASSITISMAYSLGFGAINFLFALPAIKSIDTIGRRRWLIITLPFMAIFMLGAAMSGYIEDINSRIGVTAWLNLVALVMVFLFVEETKQRSLEELDHIFEVSKRRFMRFQIASYLPWAIQKCICGSAMPRPELYRDLVWGSVSSEQGDVRRTPAEAGDHTEREQLELRPTRVPAPIFSSLERPFAAELEESYPPGIHVPYPTEYEHVPSPEAQRRAGWASDSRNASFPNRKTNA